MGLFSSKKTDAPRYSAAAEVWDPIINLARTREVLKDLIYATNTPGTSNDHVERLVFRWGEASGTPTDPMKLMNMNPDNYGEILQRPWLWLIANARNASINEEHELVGFCAFWMHNWKNVMYPKFTQYEKQFWLIGSIPPEVGSELADLAEVSLRALPEDHVLFGNDTGNVAAGPLAGAIGSFLR